MCVFRQLAEAGFSFSILRGRNGADAAVTYADKELLDAPVRDVRSVELVREPIYGTAALYPPHAVSIVVRLGNGKEAKLPATGFVENRDDVVANLKDKLGLA